MKRKIRVKRMRARLKNKIVFLLFIGILSITSCLIVVNSSQTIQSTNEKATPLLKTSSIQKIERILNEMQVNDYTADEQNYPSICTLSSDTFAVAWSGSGEGDSNGIYATVIDTTTGNNITREVRVNNYTADGQSEPSICALSSELFAVAWTSDGQDGFGEGIYATVINATTGNNITREFRVNDYVTQDQDHPSICALSSSSFAAVWSSDNQDGSDRGIFATVIDATTGNNITREFQVNDITLYIQSYPSICTLSSESFAVAWECWIPGVPDAFPDIYATVVNASTGNNITREIQVNQYITHSQRWPSICALSNESFAVVWSGEGQDSISWDIYATIIEATTGYLIIEEFRVNDYSINAQRWPSICTLSNESFVVAWSGEGEDDSNGIYTTVIDASMGTPIMAEFQVNEYRYLDQAFPSICALSNESFAVAWSGEGQADSNGIYATVLALSSGSGGGQPAIEGYDIFIFLGIALAASVFLIRKRHQYMQKKDFN